MKTCFVIMPFEPQLDSYYNKIIKPTLEELKYAVKRADEIYGIQPIIDDITHEIREADILIADVTDRNPNVNYELGYAHALDKKVVIISQTLDDIPFDYRHKRAILYNTTEVDWQEKLRNKLISTVKVLQRKKTAKDSKKQSTNDYKIHYHEMPSRATLEYRGMFSKLSARGGAVGGYMIDAAMAVIDDIHLIKLDADEMLYLRGAFFDDKYGNILLFIDYLHDHNREPSFYDDSIKRTFHDGYAYYEDQGISVEPKCYEELFSSDSFFVDSDKYYERVY